MTENNYQFFDFRITTADVFEQRHLLTNGRTTGGFMCCPLSKPAETRLITPHIDDRAPIAANFWLATLIAALSTPVQPDSRHRSKAVDQTFRLALITLP